MVKREALGTAANRLDIAANVIRSGAEFVRWAAEARAAIAPTEEAL